MPHAKGWEVCKVVGEKGMTRRSKQYKILWQNHSTTTWEPKANVDHCSDKVKEWVELKPERQHQLSQMSDTELTEDFDEWISGGEAAAVSSEAVVTAQQQAMQQMQLMTEFQEELCGLCEQPAIQRKQPVELKEELRRNAGQATAQVAAATQAQEKGPIVQQEPLGISMNLMPPRRKIGLIQEIMKRAGYSMDRLRSVMSSPPCETYSLADASNISRGWFYRDHSQPEKPPRSKESCVTAVHERMRQKAIDDDEMMRYLTESMLSDWEEGYVYDALIENPHASLRHRPFMRGERMEAAMERKTINYCAFGLKYQKVTDLWTTQKEWNPRGATGNGRCNDGACRQGHRNARTRRGNHT